MDIERAKALLAEKGYSVSFHQWLRHNDFTGVDNLVELHDWRVSLPPHFIAVLSGPLDELDRLLNGYTPEEVRTTLVSVWREAGPLDIEGLADKVILRLTRPR